MMSEKHPDETWLKIDVLKPPFYCGRCGLQNEVKLEIYSSQLMGNDVFDTYICKQEGCTNKIVIHTKIKRDPATLPKPTNKKQKRLPI